MTNNEKPFWILYMATFPPRECGIATFTKDLTKAIDKKYSPKIKSKILAMNRSGISIYNYPKNVIFQIDDTNIQEYIDVAKEINKTDAIKLVSIQHEFGIFGGENGSYLISFLEILNKPTIVTFHSVLPNPDDRLKKVVQAIAKKVACIIVMTGKGIEILREDYNITTDIVVVPHGIPSVTFDKNIIEKSKIGFEDKIILSSFGLISSGKGYEYVIDALPEVVKKFPNVLYLILGETHPVVRKQEGEKYRNSLEAKVKELGLQNNVKFYNKYLKLSGIIRYLKASDIYISSSINPNQITSGTLVYAMGCGRPVISTPILHAKDIINEERGLLTEFSNSKSFSDAIIKILSNPNLKEGMEKNAYAYTRNMTWPNVAIAYLGQFNKYLKLIEKYEVKLPKIKFKHLMKLTDNFGIIQFSQINKPFKDSGYTLDDNARAMIACCMYQDIFKDDSKIKLINIYLNFLKHVHQPDGKLYNFVDYSKKVDLKNWSEDAHGRALWALGYLASLKSIPKKLRDEAEHIFERSIDVIKDMQSPRAVAFGILGLYFNNLAKPSNKNVLKIKKLADYLISLYNQSSSDDWQWFEEYLTYSNSKLPEALLYAYLATNGKKYLKIGEKTLKFLMSITFEKERYAPIGHDGWYFKKGKRAHFDQQPVDVSSMVQTLILAYDITKKDEYKKNAINTFKWFIGNNILNRMVYNEVTGGCHDGIGEAAINLNQGAESTVSYLLARLCLHGYQASK
jgi:glycosyltransferase involved in cell wall biosynthesis